MPIFQELLNQGATHAWLFIPSAILLGALHGMEPGHSKTMMAAFIIAIRGTITQAVLLGVSAAFSHSLVIWLLAAGALHFGSKWNAETSEPYFQIASGMIIVGLAVWMFWRTRRDQVAAHEHEHNHEHEHEHEHRSVGSDRSEADYQDAHERAHAADIARRFGNRNVTTGQIVIFGLTGGLLPCPAALSVLLVCLQLKEFVLGFTLVLCFSIGLALTMVTVGAAAAWGVRHASQKFKGFSEIARKAPYFSSVILICLGLYIFLQGWKHLH
ncbi:MAG: nickel/cobalt efflux transporter [Chthoniobacterales bacterium]